MQKKDSIETLDNNQVSKDLREIYIIHKIHI